jgi:hypothetical protein
MVQHELESKRTRCHNLERQLQKQEADHEEKVTRVKLEQEERLRGMMPKELKQELEDTISSLKSQVLDCLLLCTMPKELTKVLEDTISSLKSQVLDFFSTLYDA